MFLLFFVFCFFEFVEQDIFGAEKPKNYGSTFLVTVSSPPDIRLDADVKILRQFRAAAIRDSGQILQKYELFAHGKSFKSGED